MKKTGGSVASFIAGVTPAKRRRDAETMLALMSELTGRDPELWGTIVGFGSCHYRYPTGTEGDMPVVAFSPRKDSTTVYLDRTDAHTDELAQLGPHTTGVSCLYIKDLEAVDHDVLRRVITASEAFARSGGDDYAQITITD
ncbi:DUF1801 domain-containing protein [Microbacterium sp. SS28]|uniref:DUF1801 domain-containing protein n=1 Tax=Microbacterium sp. SS28 TaxID=2919948 RepID=UPI001FAB1361|nr:DUF1801 domain-containing protein [Microbacterium sp. SS28]